MEAFQQGWGAGRFRLLVAGAAWEKKQGAGAAR